MRGGKRKYTLITLATFQDNGTAGYYPEGGLALDAAGNIYGTTIAGTGSNYGSVFEIAAGSQSIAPLATLNRAGPDWLIGDAAGNLYGTESYGGNGVGSVFELAAGAKAITTLATFNGANGKYPGNIIANAAGNLYGTTTSGGANGDGTVFEISQGSQTLKVLQSFGGTIGTFPLTLTADAAGNLYGVTQQGGSNNAGTVFELHPVFGGAVYVPSVVATFSGTNGPPRGGASLIADASGNLYGTTSTDGANNVGTVFKIAAGTNTLTTLATFNGANGAYPFAFGSLILDASGNLFGTTEHGGASNSGTVFELAAGTSTITTLTTFSGSNGYNPSSGLVADAAGNLFGMTESGAGNSGTVFELSPTTASVGQGANQTATVGGGTSVVGGVQSTLPDVTTPGTFTTTYTVATSLSQLISDIGSAAAGTINFAFANSSAVQLWQLHFDGTFTGEATVTVHFDPTLLGGIPLSELYIEHYDNGTWVPIYGTVDPIADTITFQTESFSPFVLAEVPEPSTLVLAIFVAACLSAAATRRSICSDRSRAAPSR